MSLGRQHIKWRRNIAENFNRLSRVHERYRPTDRRQTTDGRTTTYSEREREFTFAKNVQLSLIYEVELSRTELGRPSFSVAAPTVWNSIPAHLRSTLIGRRQFRDGLKSHLFADAYF